MKKILLGSTALVAAGMLAAPAAHAQIELGVGGFMEQWFGYGSSDIDDRDHFDQKSDTEIIFSGSTTLDNGIQFGVNVQLEGNTGSDQIDESYAFVEGDFGRVLLGSENSAGYIMSVSAPNVGIGINSGDQGQWVPITADSGQFRAPFGSVNVETAAVNDANRVTYFTPRFNGLQGGVSYTPDAGEDTNTHPDENAEYHNGFDIGLNFTESFGGLDIAASGRYGTASNDAGGDDPEVYAAGLNLGYGGFTVGAAFASGDDDGANDGTGYNVGARYATGPWSFSVTGYLSESEGAVGGGDEELTTIEGAVSYALGPGIRVTGSIGYNDFEDDVGGADVTNDDNDGYWIVTGLELNF